MAITTCRNCGKVCVAGRDELCAECHRWTRRTEVKVTEYLGVHVGATLEEIHKATGAERHIILRMIGNGIIRG